MQNDSRADMQSKNIRQKVYQRYVGGLYQIMTARFLEEQPPVKIVKIEDKTYIYICLNGVQKSEMYEQDGERQMGKDSSPNTMNMITTNLRCL